MPEPLLPLTLTDATVSVAIAFDGGQGVEMDDWTWTDVTADVRMAPGLNPSHGRGDEASTAQPAKCTVMLDNASGDYSAAPDGPYWPNVRQGVPVRVQVDPDGAGEVTLFLGYAASWTPSWNLSGAGDVTMTLEVAGVMRRLGQGQPPVQSAMRRVLSEALAVVGYWPCEDGKAATYFAAARGTSGMTFTGVPKPATDESFLCSAPLPQFGSASFAADVDNYTVDPVENGQQVQALFTFPDAELTDQQVILRVYTSGTIARFDIRYNTGGAMDLKGYGPTGTLLYDGGAITFDVKGTSRRISLEMYQDGANVHFGVNHVLAIDPDTFWSIPGDPNVAGTAGKITRVVINPNPDGASAAVAFGHVTVRNVRTAGTDISDGLDSYDREISLNRLYRLSVESGVEVEFLPGDYDVIDTDYMGPQPRATLLELMRGAAAVDGGVLIDGVGPGVCMVDRRAIENAVPTITIDASALQLSPPFGPVADDQRLTNSATVTRTSGTQATYTEPDGPLGTELAGVASTSAEVNCWLDQSTVQYASLMVARGTVAGYRYPQLVVDVLATPSLARAAAEVRTGHRVQVTNVRSVLPGAPDDNVDLVVEGVAHAISASGWKLTLSCSPFETWRIGTAAATTGDTSDTPLRAQPDSATGTTCYGSQNPNIGSINVITPTGTTWTTNPDDYPMNLDIGGRILTATACTAAVVGVQWFTVVPQVGILPGGTPVNLANSPVLGL